MIGAKVWERAAPLSPDERVDYTAAAAALDRDERIGDSEGAGLPKQSKVNWHA